MEEIKKTLSTHYGIGNIISIERVNAGFLSDNYKVISDKGVFFLKGYRKGIDRNRDIHKVKKFFADHGIPVILPIETNNRDTLFTVSEKVHALFPFVDGIHHNRQFISDEINIEIATVLAKMHRISMDNHVSIPAVIKFWDDEDSLKKIDELVGIISSISDKNAFDVASQNMLELKRKLIFRDKKTVAECDNEPHILIHGDFHEQNLFFDERGMIKYVFDFGEVKMAPRAQELWRSAEFMFINGVFSDENVRKVILYLRTYNALNPISKDAFVAGFNIYYQMLIHSTWVESEHYLVGNHKVDHFLEKGTINYMAEYREEFLNRVLKGVYDN